MGHFCEGLSFSESTSDAVCSPTFIRLQVNERAEGKRSSDCNENCQTRFFIFRQGKRVSDTVPTKNDFLPNILIIDKLSYIMIIENPWDSHRGLLSMLFHIFFVIFKKLLSYQKVDQLVHESEC